MKTILDMLYDLQGDGSVGPAVQALRKENAPRFERLCNALGVDAADEIWAAACLEGELEREGDFSLGFRWGALLMLELLRPADGKKTALSSR